MTFFSRPEQLPGLEQSRTASALPAPGVQRASARHLVDRFEDLHAGSSSQQAYAPAACAHAGCAPGACCGGDEASLQISPSAASLRAPTVTTDATGRTVVELGSGNDNATLSQTQEGGLRISTLGGSVTLTPEQARGAIIRGGEGNDSIQADASVTLDLALEGGVGDDYLVGGTGRDILSGGEGRDVAYGLDGEDLLLGGSGRDYLDGGRGADTVRGESGNDQVMGGLGDDLLYGGEGEDVVAGGEGLDSVRGGAGVDSLYLQAEDRAVDVAAGDSRHTVERDEANLPGQSIVMTGSEAFRARVESDLEALRSLPTGQLLLRGLDGSGRSTRIQQNYRGNSASGASPEDGYLRPDGTRGTGTDATVNYNPNRAILGGGTEEWMVRPQLVGLFHELVHAHDIARGELVPGTTQGIPNLEQSAVGLPYDHDGDPSTPELEPTQRPTENQLRAELGLTPRPRY